MAEQQLWMAWTDEGGGWIAAIHGTAPTKDGMQNRIDLDTKECGRNRWNIRPIRVTVHLADEAKS